MVIVQKVTSLVTKNEITKKVPATAHSRVQFCSLVFACHEPNSRGTWYTSKKQRKVLVLEEGRFKKGARIRWPKEKEQDETSKDVLASILYFL